MEKLNIKGEGEGELKIDSQDYGVSNYIDTDIVEYTEVNMVRGRNQEFFVLTYSLFIVRCFGSLLQCVLFSDCREPGLLLNCGVWASHCGGFFRCGAQAQ